MEDIGINPVMQPSPFAISEGSSLLHPFLEKIITKKVNQVALNIFERIVDTLCFNFYNAYAKRLAYCMNVDDNDDEENVYSQPRPALPVVSAQKTHLFSTGGHLFDRTSTQRVAVQPFEITIPDQGGIVKGSERIFIDGKPVYFNSNLYNVLLLGNAYGIEEVIVSDVKECPELVIIYTKATNRDFKVWCVDTTQPTKKIATGGEFAQGEQDIFIAQKIILHPVVSQVFGDIP